MNNNTKVRIHGSKALFESIAKEILAEAGGKSPAQKMTEKMMGKKKAMKIEEEAPSDQPTKSLKEYEEDGDADGYDGGDGETSDSEDTRLIDEMYDDIIEVMYKTADSIGYRDLDSRDYGWILKGLARKAEEKAEN